MVGEAKDANYRVIRAKYFQLHSAITEHERKVAMGNDSNPEAVADLAQKVASAICDAIKGVEYPEDNIIKWLLEAEGAIMVYSRNPEAYFKNMPRLSPGVERAIINKSCKNFSRE
ncbi:MAG: hypothetical protein QXT19_04385 [Candidatus Woesearchaeota archaeon]